MYRILLLSLVWAVSCVAPTRILQYQAKTSPVYHLDPPPVKIVFLNSYDVAALHFRDNKGELFNKLIEEVMTEGSGRISARFGIATEILPGFTRIEGRPDSVAGLLAKAHGASHAMVIDFFDIFFTQTRVDVERNYSGSKSRTAYYDITSDIGYSLYAGDSLYKRISVRRTAYHSSRAVLSGLLAAGPNIVSNRDDARDMSIDNLSYYLTYFFPGEMKRKREVFTGKTFPEVEKALARWDDEAALTESLRYVDDRDKVKAAQACYNCAVLMEKKNQPGEALYYLRKSLSLVELIQAVEMLRDFEG